MLEPFSADGVSEHSPVEPFPERFRLLGQQGAGLALTAAVPLGMPASFDSRGLFGRFGSFGSKEGKGAPGGKTKSVPKPLAKFLPKELLQVDALSPISIQVIFSRPLADEELEADTARASFKLGSDLELSGTPRLKAGTKASYIVPTALQQPGKRYTLSYRGGDKLGFKAGVDRLFFRYVRQISYDTIEVVPLLADGVADCGMVCADEAGTDCSGPLLKLNPDNVSGGRHYQIVPPLEGKTVRVCPAGGLPLLAGYVERTQLEGGVQAPQFRLPEGYAFTPGQLYAADMDWGRIGRDEFTGSAWQALKIKGVRLIEPDLIRVELAADPGCDLFAGRMLQLACHGEASKRASYVPGSRDGAAGEFRLLPGWSLQPGKTYRAAPIGPWAACPPEGMPLQSLAPSITGTAPRAKSGAR
ncbi:hypothetical protein [Paenibacillus sp. D9]|uniref:hypothetical protein n=1 Tax=Paenibacillus sp. D9 TaxID=665792 RepID=UPI0012EDA73F|nr:hypothetical protein [Paenibacillus sp. D9]